MSISVLQIGYKMENARIFHCNTCAELGENVASQCETVRQQVEELKSYLNIKTDYCILRLYVDDRLGVRWDHAETSGIFLLHLLHPSGGKRPHHLVTRGTLLSKAISNIKQID